MKRAGISLLLAGVLLALIQFTGCADTPATFNKVTIILPSGAQVIGQGQTVSIQVSVLNDAAAGGVAFTLSSPVGFGTLTQTSSTTATYTAPNPVTAETVVKIVITSVDFAKQSTTLAITVEPPPTITTTSLPTAPLNGTYNATVTATGGVPPLSWAISSGTLPAGLSLAKSTTDTVQITGKATAAGSSPFTITVTDSSAGDPPSSQQLTIVVSSLAITTTSPLPPGTVGTAYSEQFTSSGGTGNITWTVASGSTLPAGLSLSSAGLLSGTPTAGGTFTFGITATDSAVPPAVVTSTFTLVISQQQQLTLLNGSYAFEFSGYGSNGFVALAGTFTANGAGSITGGEMDFNSQLGTPLNFVNLLGSYTAGTDGRGTLTFTNTTLPAAPIFAFSVDSNGNGRFIEFDSSTTRGSGRIELQTVTSCVVSNTATNTYTGDFAFGGSGFASQAATNGAGPLAFAGRLTAVPPSVAATSGSLTQGEMDTNTPGVLPFDDLNVSGTYNSGPDGTHCTLALSSTGFGSQNYSIYPISSSDAFLIETDTVSGSTTTPYLNAGEMVQQIGQPFVTSGVLSGTMVGGLSGQIISGTTFSPEVQVVQISATSGSANFQMLQADNLAGTTINTNGTAFLAPYTSDSLGRVESSNQLNSLKPVFYLINTNQAFCVNFVENAPTFGSFAPQSAGPFTVKTIQSTSLIDGTSAPAVSTDRDLSGFLSFDGISAVGGTQDQSTTSGNTTAAETGTYVLSATGNTDGSGTMTLSTPAGFTGFFFIVSPTNVVMITTTPQDTNPVLIIIGH